MAEPFIAEIRMMSFVFAPKGWALCNGQILPINQNQALFSLLGTSFGGDGRVNFALPDLRGRVPIHVGSGHSLAERGGEQAHTLAIAEVPAHVHVHRVSTDAGSDGVASSTKLLSKASHGVVTERAPDTTLSPGTIGSAGGSQAHLNMQPFLVMSFCIALQGVFPSQV